MNNYKVGDNVRVLDTSRIELGEEIVQIGGVAEVVSVNPYGNPRLECRTGSPLVISDKELQYIEKIVAKQSKNQRLSEHDKAIATLEKEVTSLKADIEALKQAQKVPVTTIIDAVKRYNDKLPNQKRAEIIEKAKEYVRIILKSNKYSPYYYEFISNENKRVVVVLKKRKSDAYVLDRAKAKCNPDDVFNEDIGRAIAIGRLKGLDVSEFENAVRPTVAIGQIIEVVVTDGIPSGKFHKVDSIKVGAYGSGDKKYPQFKGGWCSKFLIHNDTNAEYGNSSNNQ